MQHEYTETSHPIMDNNVKGVVFWTLSHPHENIFCLIHYSHLFKFKWYYCRLCIKPNLVRAAENKYLGLGSKFANPFPLQGPLASHLFPSTCFHWKPRPATHKTWGESSLIAKTARLDLHLWPIPAYLGQTVSHVCLLWDGILFIFGGMMEIF